METNNKQEPSEYYDEIYKNGDEKTNNYLKKFKNASHFKIWQQIEHYLKPHENIIELGCGTGQLAEMLISKGYNYKLGIDFSHQAIDIARKKIKFMPGLKHDILSLDKSVYKEMNVVIATEVLEHITDDLKVLEQIPSGLKIFATVPNFGGKGHVRFFKNEQEITDRYSRLLNILTIIPFRGKHTIFLIIASKK